MNKTKFIEELEKKLNYDKGKCEIINSIVEDTFLIGKKNKDIMIDRFKSELKVSDDDANVIYETVMNIIKSGLIERLKHPFKDLNK